VRWKWLAGELADEVVCVGAGQQRTGEELARRGPGKLEPLASTETLRRCVGG
jgi:hypothetical protein